MLTLIGLAALSDFSYMQQSGKDDGFTNLIMLRKVIFFSQKQNYFVLLSIFLFFRGS